MTMAVGAGDRLLRGLRVLLFRFLAEEERRQQEEDLRHALIPLRPARRVPSVRVAAAALLAVALALASAAAAKDGTPGFPLGVAAGEITPTSAKLWARAPKAGPVALHVLPPGAGTRENPLRAYSLSAGRPTI